VKIIVDIRWLGGVKMKELHYYGNDQCGVVGHIY
jgi:hypothetical protein